MSETRSKPFLSVVIPAFNEQYNLPSTLESITSWLQTQNFAWDVTVVDDGSTDETGRIVSDWSREHEGVRLLQYRPNRGKGFAVCHGMTQVRGDWRLFTDADNSTSIDHVEQLLVKLEGGETDLVIGSRRTSGANIDVHQSWWKELFGDLGSLWIRAFAVPGIRDTQAGFKLVRGDAADRLFPLLTVERWAFDVELLAVAQHLGYRICEHPIRWSNDPNTKVSLGSYFQVLVDVLRIRRNLNRGIYGPHAS